MKTFEEFLNEKQDPKEIEDREMDADVKAYDEAVAHLKAHPEDLIPHPHFLNGIRKILS